MTEEKRRKRREIRLMQRESTWLQKALFALGKAEEARESIEELLGNEPGPYDLPLDGGALKMTNLEDALEERIQELMEGIRERRRTVR